MQKKKKYLSDEKEIKKKMKTPLSHVNIAFGRD